MVKVNKIILFRFLAFAIIVIAWTPYFHRVTSLKALSRLVFSHKPFEILTVTILSEYQGGVSKIEILLPRNFSKDKSYKVLYILPTVAQKWDFWWNGGIIEAYDNKIADRFDLICVHPYIEKMPWFADHPTDPKIRQESHILKVVVPYIDSHYPTIKAASGRYLLGISKSGTGAYTLLLRHPDVFGKAVGFDAPLMSDTIHQVPGLQLEAIYGTDENFENYFIPKLLLKQASLLRKGEPRIILLGYADLLNHLSQAHDFMGKLGIPHIYDVRIKRLHNWQSGWFEPAVEYLVGTQKN